MNYTSWVRALSGFAAILLGWSFMGVAQAGAGDAALTAVPDPFDVRRFGAVGDGKTDDTAAFQKVLDAAGKAGGGTVLAPRGNYFFAGHLNVPNAVTLAGIWQSVPAHNGLRDRGLPKPTDDGTTFLVTEGAGKEDGPAFITLNTNSTLKGVVLYYPEQNANDVPKPYPWAIAMRGKNPAVLAVEMLNPYNGIEATRNERHLIRDVQGQPLRRGILVDSIYDIGRIENVHFNPWWSTSSKLFQWQMENGEAFIFGRADWQYVFNTFCFGYNIGYRFIQTKAGACNGQFSGIGADAAQTCVQVDAIQYMGLLITNGQFVAFTGKRPVELVVSPTCTGQVRLVNCAFWGPASYNALLQGRSLVGLSDCFFSGRNDEAQKADHPLIVAEAGKVQIRGCSFGDGGTAIRLGPGLEHAIVTGNNGKGGVKIVNEAGTRATIRDNEPARPG